MHTIPVSAALAKVFRRPRAWAEAALIALAVAALFVLVPVWTTPGDDVLFQLSLVKPSGWAVIVVLSILNGILIEMQLYLRRNRLIEVGAKQATTALGIAVSSLFATIGCASCYSSLLALLGLGGSAFVVTNRWWFAAGAIGLTLFALAHTSRRVMGLCAACDLSKKPSFRLW